MQDGQEKSVNRNRKAAYTNEKMKKKVKKEGGKHVGFIGSVRRDGPVDLFRVLIP